MQVDSPSKRAKVSPQIGNVITVVPTVCQPPTDGDIEIGQATLVTVPVADAVPTTWAWSTFNPVVVPEPVSRSGNSESLERERVLLGLYQRSRFIRVVAVIDCAFIIVFGLFQPVFFVLLPFPICGYIGARRWVYRLLFIYAVYLVIEIIGGIISMVLIHSPAFIAVRAVYVVINMIIVRYTTNLASYVLVLEDADFEFLKTSPLIVNIEKSLLC